MKLYKWIVIAISVFLMFFNSLLPPILGLGQLGMSIICIFAGTMALLLLVDLNWPLLLSILAYSWCGVYSVSEAVSLSLGNSVFWFVALSGLLIVALERCGVIKRIALWFLTRPSNNGHPWRFVASLFLSALLIGCIMDPTALVILFSALTEEILKLLGRKKGDRFGELLMIGILVFIGMSYGITPIGHPVPVMMLSMFEPIESVNFLHYCVIGLVVAAVYFVIVMLIMKFVFRLDVSALKDFDPAALNKLDVPPLDKSGKISCGIYIGVIVLWLLPSFIQGISPELYAKLSSFGTIMPLLLGLILLNVIHVDGKPVMNFGASLKETPWMACIPSAAAMLIGGSLSHADAGITDALATALGPALSQTSPALFVIIVCLLCTVMTNVSSDMVTSILFATISVTLISSGVIQGVNITGLCVALGVCASCAYATPPGAAYAAVIAGSGWVRVKKQLLDGGLFGLAASLSCSLVGYSVAALIF